VAKKKPDRTISSGVGGPTQLLIAAWPKSEREDLERDDYKAIGKTIARIQTQLDQRRNL